MILVDGDPTRDIADLHRIDLVFSRGRIYAPAQIEAASGIAPRRLNRAAPARRCR